MLTSGVSAALREMEQSLGGGTQHTQHIRQGEPVEPCALMLTGLCLCCSQHSRCPDRFIAVGIHAADVNV